MLAYGQSINGWNFVEVLTYFEEMGKVDSEVGLAMILLLEDLFKSK